MKLNELLSVLKCCEFVVRDYLTCEVLFEGECSDTSYFLNVCESYHHDLSDYFVIAVYAPMGDFINIFVKYEQNDSLC